MEKGGTDERRDEHLVAWADPQRKEGKIEGRCPRVYRYRIDESDGLCQFLLEGGDLLALDQLSGTNDIQDPLGIFLIQGGPGMGDH